MTEENAFNRQRRDQYHQHNLASEQGPGATAEILRELSEVNDLPINAQQDDIMGQVISKLASTANLSPEEVKSFSWYPEIILVLYMSMKPSEEGMHSGDRVWAHDDTEAAIEPLTQRERIELEAAVGLNSKLALSRSEGMAAAKEATRNVSESFVHDEASENSGKGGLLGRLRS